MIDPRSTEWSIYRPVRQFFTTLSLPDGRDIDVCLSQPEGPPPPEGWPCLVVLDGERFFAPIAGAAQALADRPAKTHVSTMVVVAISHRPAAGPLGWQRITDFTQSPEAEPEPGTPPRQGHAGQFRNLLIDSILPLILHTGDVDPRRITLFGHSLAGLFVLETLAAHPALFARWVSISPSLWWHSPDPAIATHDLLVGCGALETRRNMLGRIEQWCDTAPTDRIPQYFCAPRADHGSAPFALLPDILRWASIG